MTVTVAKTLQHPIHDEEGDDGEGGSESFPHHARVPVVSAESVRQEVDEGVTHQGAHSKRDKQLQGGLLVRALTNKIIKGYLVQQQTSYSLSTSG